MSATTPLRVHRQVGAYHPRDLGLCPCPSHPLHHLLAQPTSFFRCCPWKGVQRERGSGVTQSMKELAQAVLRPLLVSGASLTCTSSV